MNDWIDISITIKSGMAHWPDNPDIKITQMMDMEKGDVCNVTAISLGCHTGTHMDGLNHFIRGSTTLDKMPLNATIGHARVIQVDDPVSIKLSDVQGMDLQKGERILFKTKNSGKAGTWNEFDKDFVYISHEAARFIAKAGVMTVGVDYLSVGGYYKDGVETHHELLGPGVWVIEGLDLSKVTPGTYELICLPMKILNSDGAPARAILRKA